MTKKDDKLSILKSIDDLILVVKPDGEIDTVLNNSSYYSYLNVPENYKGISIFKVFPCKISKKLGEIFQNFKNNSKEINIDFPINTNEEKIWLTFRIVPVIENEQSFNKIMITIRDISGRKQVEEKYQRIFENAVMGIYESTIGEGKHISANPALAKIYGYESVSELQNNITSISKQLFVNPKRRELLLNELEKNDEVKNFESEVYRTDGSKIWISENARAIKDKNGKLKHIVGTVKNISSEKIAEEKLKQAKEDWERTFNSIHEIVLILDGDLKLRRVNDISKKMLQLEDKNPIGKDCNEILRCAKSKCEHCPAKLTIQDKKIHSAEVIITELDKTFMATSSPQFDESGNISGIVYIARDISKEKKLKQQAEYHLQQVIQADKLKALGEMVASVAHEVNNPNNFISINNSLLEKSWKVINPLLENFINKSELSYSDKNYYSELQDEIDQIIISLKNGSKRIKNIVSNLSEYAGRDSNTMLYNVDLNSVLEKAFLIVNAQAKKTFQNIQIKYQKNCPKIKASFQQLEQVYINLISNSIQAVAQKKNSMLKISIGSNPNKNYVFTEVTDNGIGIDISDIDRIFEPFYTTHRKKGGTGLGLSVSYEIIKAHKGKIQVISANNIGTLFKLYFPIDQNLEIIVDEQTIEFDDFKNAKNIVTRTV